MYLPALLVGITLAAPLPPRLTADVDDAYAPKVNPAGLGFVGGTELRVLLSREFTREAGNLGFYGAASFGALSLGATLELDDLSRDAIARPGLAFSLGSPRSAAIGFGWTGGPVDTLSAGLTVRLSRYLGVAVSSLDLAQNAGPRPYDFGLALRFFDDRVLLSSRWRLLHGEPVSHDDGKPDLRALLSLEPIDGIVLAAEADLHFRPSISVSLSFDHLLAGGFLRSTPSKDLDSGGIELALLSRDVPTLFRAPKVAVLELSGDLVPPATFNLLRARFEVPVYGSVPLLIEELAQSDEVAGALLKIGTLDIGWGRAEEIRAGIARIVQTGKRADCFLSSAHDLEMFVASACSSVIVIPALPINVDGIAANMIFLADGLEMVGVRPQVVARGKYKSAPETFTRASISEAQRESMDALLRDTYATLVDGIAEGRRLERSVVEEIVAQGTLTATEAKARRLVDAVLYPDQLEAWLRQAHGRAVGFVDAEDISRPTRKRWSNPPQIALVSIDAVITGGESSELPLGLGRQSGAQTLARVLEQIKNDRSVVGVVLRVESPGGDAIASDLIARQVRELARVKPVIASFGDVAASGGYYVAAGARAIYAEKTSVTGSIGIFDLGFSIEGLLGKLGVHADSIELGPGSNRGTLLRDWTPAEQEMGEREVEALYAQFLSVVEEGRKMPAEQARARAEGRIYSGRAAKEQGLVDEIGGLMDAIRRARQEAGLLPEDEADVLILPRGGLSFPEVVRGVVGADPPSLASIVPHSLRGVVQAAVALSQARSTRGVALLPFVLEVD